MTDKEKLLKLRKLADAMYYAAQYLTTDASKLHKAMDEYHQFIINEYHKEEPTIPDIVDEHYWEMLGEEHVSNKMGGINNALSQDILAMKSVDEAMAEVEAKAKAFTEAHKGESSEQLLAEMRGEDPANEDLEKEIEIYMGTNLEWDSDALRDPIESWGIKIARHFAAWQKEQDKQWLAENHKHIFAKGRESAEVWISADDDVNNAAEKTTRRFCKISLLSGDYLSLAEAQPQVNKESKLIAIKSFVCGAQWDRNKLMKEAVEEEVIEIIDYNSSSHHEYSRLMIEVDKEKFKEGDKVRVLIIKED